MVRTLLCQSNTCECKLAITFFYTFTISVKWRSLFSSHSLSCKFCCAYAHICWRWTLAQRVLTLTLGVVTYLPLQPTNSHFFDSRKARQTGVLKITTCINYIEGWCFRDCYFYHTIEPPPTKSFINFYIRFNPLKILTN
jgi:hypothetical protein